MSKKALLIFCERLAQIMRKSLMAALFYRVTRAIFSRRSLVKSDFKRMSGREFRNKLKSLLADEAFFTYVQYSIGKLKNI